MAERQLTLTDRRLGLATASAAAAATTPCAGSAERGDASTMKNVSAETPEDLQAAMEVNVSDEIGDYVGRDSGRMTVRVRGSSIGGAASTSGEEEEHAGWIVATRRGRKTERETTIGDVSSEHQRQQLHRPRSPGKRPQLTRTQIKQRVNIKMARAARMPSLPANDHRIIVRPRCGFAIGKQDLLEFVAAMAASARIPLDATLEDTVCPNIGQNIVVISTPSRERADKYDKVRAITLKGTKYEVFAYRAAPNDTVKGIIYNIPLAYTQADINACLIGERNPTILAAHRMGETTAVVVLFEGQVVPQHIKFASLIVRCKIYKQHREVCRQCGEVGHRKDVCPRPDKNVCFACGQQNPPEDHETVCKPSCKLCGGPHPSGTGRCRNKYKTPFLVRQRKMAANGSEKHKGHVGTVSFGGKEDFPQLQRVEKENNGGTRQRSLSRNNRSKSRERSKERKRSHSNNRMTWAKMAARRNAPPPGHSPLAEGGRLRGMRDKSTLSQRGEGNNEVAALREVIAQLQETIKEQKKIIDQLMKMQPPPQQSQLTWQLGNVPRPPAFAPAGDRDAAPSQPPIKMRKRTGTVEAGNEEGMVEEPPKEDTGNSTAEIFNTDECRLTPDDAGINYGVRIHKLSKRMDKQAGQIKVLGEKIVNIEQTTTSIKRDIVDLKQFITKQLGTLGGKQHETTQAFNDGP